MSVLCCKPFKRPATAPCTHTLCHNCWIGRRSCPECAVAIERRNLKLNLPLQYSTECVIKLRNTFEKHFKVQLDEFILETDYNMEAENDASKMIKDWLTSSQNHFSMLPQTLSQDISLIPNQGEVSTSKVLIHNNDKKSVSPKKVRHVTSVEQDDWDKIEPMPDTETVLKDKENVIGPMDIEPFYIDDNEYNSNNPRRSSRKRAVTNNDSKDKTNNISDKVSPKDFSCETELKSNKTKKNWNNVKRMRKEFSKLNKMNRSKLNVSIEMCKKSSTSANKPVVVQTPPVYEIDDNTPALIPENVDEQASSNVITNSQTMSDIPAVINNNVDENNHNTTHKSSGNNQLKQDEPLNSRKNCPHESTSVSTNMTQEIVKSNTNNVVVTTSKMPFYKKSSLHPKNDTTKPLNINRNDRSSPAIENDDIEITIKVGNTITNIFIKKKNNIDVKTNTEREIQTSLVSEKVETKSAGTNVSNIHIDVGNDHNVNVNVDNGINPSSTTKSISDKKYTDSAKTVTAQFEITESVEKELSNIMECEQLSDVDEIQTQPKCNNTLLNEQCKEKPITSNFVQPKNSEVPTSPDKRSNQQPNSEDSYLNDLDIFETGSVREVNVQLLKTTKNTPSEILGPTYKSKKTQKTQNTQKRIRDCDANLEPQKKKSKLNEKSPQVKCIEIGSESNIKIIDSEPMNYDLVMGKVFADIDADLEDINSGKITKKNNKEIPCSDKTNQSLKSQNVNVLENQKHSENLFSVCVEDKEDNIDKEQSENQVRAEDFLTPVERHTLESTNQNIDVNDDSDKSVVEETPQKNSFTKVKQKSIGVTKQLDESQRQLAPQKVLKEINTDQSIVNLTDTEISNNNTTVVEGKQVPLETPLNIDKFCSNVQYKSTPVARKSLNFDDDNNQIDDDPEQTLCPTTEIAKTTQEREFLNKAFEKTPVSLVKPYTSRTKPRKLCIAGSCLTSAEITKLNVLCVKYNFTYVNKFTPELTHLVVAVDEENKSQRSVKFMCALAASKWIVSMKWVDQCLKTDDIVNEENYEVLDNTGEPGPMRSRLAQRKIFENITFYCFAAFTVLDVDTLKMMLTAAGGTVVDDIKQIQLTTNKGPALLLAEPENTQEDRFIYLALELKIVPVNHEWVLNCLGSYTLGSIYELLLCPYSILHKNIQQWPRELIAREDD